MSKLVEESVESKEEKLEQRLTELKNKELWFEDQVKRPDGLFWDAYFTDAPKKTIIDQFAASLEERHEIELELKLELTVKSVHGISTYIKQLLKKLGVKESTLHYVHETLGVKYKYEKYNHPPKSDGGDNPPQSSSKPIAVNFEEENKPFIQTIDQQMDLLHNLKNKLKSSRFSSGLEHTERLKYEETNLRIQATQLFASQVLDDRQSVPIFAQYKLVMAIVAATNNSAAGLYVDKLKLYGANKALESENYFKQTYELIIPFFPKKLKKLFRDTFNGITKVRNVIQKIIEKNKTKKPVENPIDVMTSKQAMKTLNGLIKNVTSVFDHMEVGERKDRDAALLDGCYGISCPECGSYRIRELENEYGEWLLFCYKCEWWIEAKSVSKCRKCHIPFFDEILDVVLKSSTDITNEKDEPIGAKESKCPRCQTEIILPAKMFLKPRLIGK